MFASLAERAGYGLRRVADVRGHRRVRAGRRGDRRRPQGDVRLRRQGRPPRRAAARGHGLASCGPSSSTARRRRGRSGTPAPNFRYERPQAGRYRQHHQVGVEVLGADDPDLDVEVIALARRLLPRASGCARCTLLLNSLGDAGDRARYLEALRGSLRRARRRPRREQSQETLAAQPAAGARLEARRRTRPVIADAPRIARLPVATSAAAHFDAVQAGPRRARHRRSCIDAAARPRPRLLHAHDVRVRRPTRSTRPRTRSAAAAATTAWSRQLGGPPTPGIGFGSGIERIAARLRRRGRVRRRPTVDASTCSSSTPTGGERGARRSPPSCAPPASPPTAPSTTGRMKAQMKAADRSGAAARGHRRRATSWPTATVTVRDRCAATRGEPGQRCPRDEVVDYVRKSLSSMQYRLSLRTHLCGELRAERRRARPSSLCGWVARRREHGEHLAFVDLRDHTGIVQCVVDGAVDVRSEYVVRVTGTVARPARGHRQRRTCRPARSRSATATVEILSVAEPPPFPIDDRADDVDENVRLQYRYLDLRRERMQRNLRIRARGQLGDPRGDGAPGLRRGRDADAHAVDARGRPRVPRAVAPAARLVLRAAAEPAAVQAAADGRRRRPLLPDRPLPARRGPARRPPVRVHAARRRDELRRPGRRARRSSARPCSTRPRRSPASGRRRSSASRGTRRWTASASTSPTCASAWSWSSSPTCSPATEFKAFAGAAAIKGIRVPGSAGELRPQQARRAHRPGQAARAPRAWCG